MKKSLLLGLLSIFLSAGVDAAPIDYSKPVLATIIGIENDEKTDRFLDSQANLPLFGSFDQSHPKNTYDRNRPEWWDNLIEELQFSKVHVAMTVSRGCKLSEAELIAAGGYPNPYQDAGNGNSCPRILNKLVEALSRNNVPAGGLRFAYFDDTASYPFNNSGTEDFIAPDITETEKMVSLMWDHNAMVYFDTVPSQYWYRDEIGRPVMVIWSPNGVFANIDNNSVNTNAVNDLFSRIRTLFYNRYGVYPAIYLHHEWVDLVANINANLVQGAYGWINPDEGEVSGFVTWNGVKMGTVAPGFRNQRSNRGCGSSCREVKREHGESFKDGMEKAYGLKDGVPAKFVIIEGFANIPESAGFYRSSGADYDFPNQYLNRLRDWADPNPSEIIFQAEASDYRQGNNSSGNQGGSFSNDDLDVGKLSTPGHYVGWASNGEVIGFKRVKLPAKPYEIRVRTATPLARQAIKVSFELQPDVQTDEQVASEVHTTVFGPWTLPLPNTGSLSSFQETQIAVFKPIAGYYNIKIEFVTNGFNVDWLKITEASPDCSGQYAGLENVVGLNQGMDDPRFLCKSKQWYSCGWGDTATWVQPASSGQVVGDFQCNASAARWQPLVNSCSATYNGTDNVVGLSNGTGDPRFLCKSHRWYACNWGTSATWATSAQFNQIVGSYRCDGAAWVPL